MDAPVSSLSPQQRAHFRQHGWLRLPGVIPEHRRLAALGAIHASIGEHGLDPARMAEFNQASFCPELRADPALTGLLTATAALPLAESMMGPGQVLPGATAQIALRFPQREPAPPPSLVPHIDGFSSPHNGVAAGTIYSFDALAAVFLADVTGPWAGNFTVWPGTHLAAGEWFRHHPPDPSLPQGVPPIALGDPLQIDARAGDLVFCHYLLVHAAAPNRSPHIRYAVFFRLHHAAHRGRSAAELLGAPFRDWQGIDAA